MSGHHQLACPLDSAVAETERLGNTSAFDWIIWGLFFLLVVSVPLFFSLYLTTYTLPKIALTQFFVSLLLGSWFLKMDIQGQFTFKPSVLFFPILTYFVISVFSLFSALSLPGGLSLLGQIFTYVFAYFIVINQVREEEIETWSLIFSLVGILVSAYGIMQYFGIEPLLQGYDYIPVTPYSTFGHRNQAAQYLILVIPLSGAFVFFSSSWIKRGVFAVSTAMMVYHLFLTKSRGAILGFLLSILCLLGLSLYRWLRKYSPALRRKWLAGLLVLFSISLAWASWPRPLTLKVKHVNPVGYYIHSIDGSKIPANQAIRIEFEYRTLRGDSKKSGYVNLFGERTNTAPIYLTQEGEGWKRLKAEDILFISTPYDEEIKLRWVPGGDDSAIQLREIRIQTRDGVSLVKDPLLQRLFSKLGIAEIDKAVSSQARLYMYRNTIEMIKSNFFLGAGFGNFKYVYPRYRDRGEWALSGLNTRVEQAHSEYLQILSEVGILGFLGFLWILWRIGKMAWFVFQKAEMGRLYWIGSALTMGITGTLVQSSFDFGLQNPASGMMFWVAVGFLEVVYHSAKEAKHSLNPSSLSFRVSSKAFRGLIGIGIVLFALAGIYYSLRPVAGDFYLKRARYFMMVKDWGSAFFDLERATFFTPHDFDVYFHLGQINDQRKHYDLAIHYYKKAIFEHPYFVEARNNLGAVYIKTGSIDEAIEEFKGSIEINPYHPGLHNNLGYLYGKRNLFKQALEEYHKTLELDPENPEVHKNLGLLYFYKLKDYPRAQQYWERYLILNPADPQSDLIKARLEEIKKGATKP